MGASYLWMSRTGRWAHHEEVYVGLTHFHEAMPSVERPDWVPLQIPEPHRESQLIRHREAVAQNARSEPATVMRGSQIELVKLETVCELRDRQGTDGLFELYDTRQRALPEALLVKLSLERLVPPPARNDMRAYCASLDLEGEITCGSGFWEEFKPDVRL